MKEVTRTRYCEARVTIRQGTQAVKLMFENRSDYEAFAMAFNEAFGDDGHAVLEAEFYSFESPVSALPEEE